MVDAKAVRYRDIAGLGVYPAQIRHVHPDGRVDVEVDGGLGEPVRLSRIAFLAADQGQHAACFPVAS